MWGTPFKKGNRPWNTGLRYKSKPCSEETKRKISLAQKGKRLGCKLSEEHRKKISNGLMGHKSSCKGIKLSEETKLKISQKLKGRIPKNIEIIKNYWKGKKLSKERCLKMGESRRGVKQTATAIESRRKSLIGHRVSLATAIKISDALRGKPQPWNCKEKHWNWMNDKSSEKYTPSWTDNLREEIRIRDNYTCKICGFKQEDMIGKHKKLPVHHIDYNKKNCEEKNLITLCISCHMKTGFKREYWIGYFKQFI